MVHGFCQCLLPSSFQKAYEFLLMPSAFQPQTGSSSSSATWWSIVVANSLSILSGCSVCEAMALFPAPRLLSGGPTSLKYCSYVSLLTVLTVRMYCFDCSYVSLLMVCPLLLIESCLVYLVGWFCYQEQTVGIC